MLRRVGSFVALILVATLVLAACGQEEAEVKPTVTRIPVANAPVPPTATVAGAEPSPVAGGSTEATTPAGAATETTFNIAMMDVEFDVKELTVPANTDITINLENKGELTHTFDITELNVNSGEYAPGQKGTVTFNSGAPAEYDYFCAIPGHRESGMVGKLIVSAEATEPVPAGAGTTTAPATSPATTAASAPAIAPTQTTFDVAMLDVEFDLKDLTVPANTEITINLENKGALTHTFDITELNVNSGEYTPGQKGTVTFNSGAPAEYEYFCAIPGHRESGMVGKLIVVAAAAEPAPAGAGTTTAPVASPAASPAAALSTTFDVAMEDIMFSVTELKVPANTDITINLENQGSLTHNFSIPELKVDSGEFAAGQKGTITFNSGAPAEYQYYCNIPGHKDLGMVGKLIVVDQSAGAATAVSGTPVAAPTSFDVELQDIMFSVTVMTVPANTEITVNLTNAGFGPHNFNIDELKVASGDLGARENKTITFNSGAPGTYEYYCNIPGHRKLGMVGKIIVQ